MDQLLALLAAAMNEGRASAPALDAKAVANSLGVAEDAQADVIVGAIARLLKAADAVAGQVRLFANSLGVPETADQAAIAVALKQRTDRTDPTDPTDRTADGTKLLAICNALGAAPDQPLAELLARVGSVRSVPAQSAAERLVENAISVERKITPANREAFIRLATQDLEGAKKILNSMPPVLSVATSGTAAGDASVLDESDEWAIQQHGLKREDYLKTKKALAR